MPIVATMITARFYDNYRSINKLSQITALVTAKLLLIISMTEYYIYLYVYTT